MAITVVIPSRGRPERARDVLDAIRTTAVLADTHAFVVADHDDPLFDRYRMLIGFARGSAYLMGLEPGETGDLVRATNTASMRVARAQPDAIIANWGDDHMPRTPGWDLLVAQALPTPGIAYGDDLLQGEALPTAPFISASIVNALGWYFLPSLRHMYVDDAAKTLGEALGILRYLPDVIIEHVHPGAGKAEMDEGYLRADASTIQDRDAFNAWRLGPEFHADVARVSASLAVPA